MAEPQVPLGYLTSCPQCGGQLQAHVGPAQDAPWLCAGCARGWWCAELTADARKLYQPERHGFGRYRIQAVEAERYDALERGHSVSAALAVLPGVAEQLDAYRRRKGGAR